MAAHFITGLDIGTATTRVVVAERQKDGRPLLRLVFSHPSYGIRKGAITDLGEASQVAGRVLAEVKKFSRAALQNVYVSVGTPQARTQVSRGITAVSRVDAEIYQDDVDRVIRASQAVNLPPNQMILHNVQREFIVDGVGDISDPIGLSGSRLEVNALIIDAFAPHVKGIMRATELAGGRIGGLIFSPIVASRSALSKSQKDLGVALIDIGFGTTGLCVYEENKLLHTSIFPAGAGNITNDIAIGLKIPVAVAEKIKLNHGYAIARDVGNKESVELAKFMPGAQGEISRRLIAGIIEVRLAEIFDFINNELKLLGKAGELPGGAVLVGGGAKMPGITDLVKQELKLSSQIGLAVGDEWAVENPNFSEFFEDPEYVNVFGLVLYGADQEKWRPNSLYSPVTIKNIFRYFLP